MKSASLLLIALIFAAPSAWAQSDLDQIENMFSKDQGNQETYTVKQGQKLPVPTQDMSQVRRLEPFKDIAVIEKRFLPKTKRFEVFAGGGGIINDAFFNNYEGGARLAWYLSEAWGAEFSYLAVGTSEKTVTSDLHTKHGVDTNQFVAPLSYYGGSVKYTPFYGKMALLNRRLIHFDHYFTAGAGMVSTNQRTNPVAAEIGTGQLYAITKSWAFRWDVTWLFYSSNTINGTAESTNNLFLTLGVSFFFPEATYR